MKTKNRTLEKLEKLRETVIAQEKAKAREAAAPGAPDSDLSPAASPSAVVGSAKAASASSPRGRREKKSGELNARISEAALERLQSHLGAAGWTLDDLLNELIVDGVDAVAPAITYRGVVLARENVYRVLDRISRRPGLRIRSGGGEYLVTARAENDDYRHWLEIYQKRDDPDAAAKASEMTVFILREKLAQYPAPGAAHIIYPEDFLVERLS